MVTQTDFSGNTSDSYVEVIPTKGGASSSPRKPSSGKGSSVEYTCKNSTALNFSNTGIHKESLCIYTQQQTEVPTPTTNLGQGEQCLSSQLLTQNMKAGDRNGNYSN